MKKIILFLCLMTISFGIFAQDHSYTTYEGALEAGKAFQQKSKYIDAMKAFTSAKYLTKDAEKVAAAIMQQSYVTSKIHYDTVRNIKRATPQSEIQEGRARLMLEGIIILPGISDDTKAEAYVAMANLYTAKKYEYNREQLKRDNYTQVLNLKNTSAKMRNAVLVKRATDEDCKELIESKTASDEDKAWAYRGLATREKYDQNKKVALLEKIVDLPKATAYQRSTAIVDAANAYSSLKKYAEAKAVLAKMDNIKDVDFYKKAQAYRFSAEINLFEKNVPAAKKDFEKIIKLKGKDVNEEAKAEIHNGASFEKYKMLEDAESSYKSAAKKKNISVKQEAEALAALGNLYGAKLDNKSARDTWERITKLKLDSPYVGYKVKAYDNTARTFYAEKNYKEAGKNFEKMAELDGITALESQSGYFLLAQAQEAEKNTSGAISTYKKIAESKKGSVLLRMQSVNKIIAIFDAQSKPEDAATYYALGWPLKNLHPYGTEIPNADQQNFAQEQTNFNNLFWKRADSLGRDKKTMNAVLIMLQDRVDIGEKYQTSDKSRSQLDIARIYISQGKKEKAKPYLEELVAKEVSGSYYRKEADKMLEIF